jgi:hypothetical protein
MVDVVRRGQARGSGECPLRVWGITPGLEVARQSPFCFSFVVRPSREQTIGGDVVDP